MLASAKARWEVKEVVKFYYDELKPTSWVDFESKLSKEQEDLLLILGLNFKMIFQTHFEVFADMQTEALKQMSYFETLAHFYSKRHQELIQDPQLGPEVKRLSNWLLQTLDIQGVSFDHLMECVSTLYERRPTHRVHKKKMLLLFSGLPAQ